MFRTCCSELICIGCVYANFISNKHDNVKANRCPFCREPGNDDENDKRMMKRVKANDPAAMCQKGAKCHKEDDYNGALKYFTKAAELGDINAHFRLGYMYGEGEGVEKDEEKELFHFEKAAIGGHPMARQNLAAIEQGYGNMKRAVKHLIIGANLGFDLSMKTLWMVFKNGHITKEDLDTTLRAHQAAIDATKSTQRDAAEASGLF